MTNTFYSLIIILLIACSGGAEARMLYSNEHIVFKHFHKPDYVNIYFHGIVTEPLEYKSKSQARLYSAGLTALPLVLARGMSIGFRLSDQSGSSLLLITTGILIGPSSGSLYAEDWNLARRSIIIRSLSASVLASGYFLRDVIYPKDLPNIMQLTSGVFLAGYALYDIVMLSAHSVDYYNMRVRLETGFSFSDPVPNAWRQMSGTVNPYYFELPQFNARLFF